MRSLFLVFFNLLIFCSMAIAQRDDVAEGCFRDAAPHKIVHSCNRLLETTKDAKTRGLALFRSGSAYSKMGEHEDAVFDLEEALKLRPDDPEVLSKLGWARFKADEKDGSHNDALADLSSAIELSPNMARYYQTRGYINLRSGRTSEAIRDYSRAIELRPDFARAYSDRGWAYAKNRNFEAAVDDYSKAIEIDPGFAAAYVTRCWLKIERDNDNEGALADCSKAIEIDPNSKWAYDNRGWAHMRLGNFDTAIDDFTEALKIDPKLAVAYNGRGLAYWKLGMRRRAIDEFSLAIGFNKDFSLAYANRALVQEERHQAHRAIADYEAILDIAPKGFKGKWAYKTAQSRLAVLLDPKRQGTSRRSLRRQKSRRIALVIGNSDYQHVSPLDNPAIDAHAISDAFRGLGFHRVIERHNLDRSEFLEALSEFSQEAHGADWAIIYFAGHGLQVDGSNYLIPADYKPEDVIGDAGVALDDLLQNVLGARELRLVILDACRNNPFRKAETASLSGAMQAGFSIIEPLGGVVVQYSARHGTIALDGAPGGNSPYASELLKLLQEPALEVGLFFRKVREGVISRTRGEQVPAGYGLPPGQRIYFRPPK
jgi:tetratricopeptide (TPR) repeat protein